MTENQPPKETKVKKDRLEAAVGRTKDTPPGE